MRPSLYGLRRPGARKFDRWGSGTRFHGEMLVTPPSTDTEDLMSKNSPSSKAQSSSKAERLYNPSTQFSKPDEILEDAGLSKEEKKTALGTWEQDARQLMTASNEGMPGKQEGLQAEDHHQLGEVGRAKAKIGAKPKHKPSH